MLPSKKLRRDAFAQFILKNYASAVLLNYETDANFLHPDFTNVNHLNSHGAKKFTLKLDSIIDAMLFKNDPDK